MVHLRTQTTGIDELQTVSILFKLYMYNRLISLKKVKKTKMSIPINTICVYKTETVFTWKVAYDPLKNPHTHTLIFLLKT